jgi:hypothetical protein
MRAKTHGDKQRVGNRRGNPAFKRMLLEYYLRCLIEHSFRLITRVLRSSSFDAEDISHSLFLIMIVAFIGVLVLWIFLYRKH